MLYGAAMVAVQGLEHAVRWLYVVADTDPTKVSRASLERQWRHAMERLWRAFQTGTAAMKLNDAARGVKPRLDADVAAELERFLKGPRNRLVHGFLIERLRRTPDGEECFVQGTALELIEASRVAGTLTARLYERADEIRATWPQQPEPPTEVREALELIGRVAMLKEFPV